MQEFNLFKKLRTVVLAWIALSLFLFLYDNGISSINELYARLTIPVAQRVIASDVLTNVDITFPDGRVLKGRIINGKIKDGVLVGNATVETEDGTFVVNVAGDDNGPMPLPGTIVSTELADGSVTEEKLASNSVTGIKIVDGTITAGKLVEGIIVTKYLADGSVTSIKLADGSVTSTKLLDGVVVTDKIGDAAITEIKLADGSVTNGKLADFAVTADKIANATITDIQLADNSVISIKIQNGAVTEAKLADGSVTTTKIFDGAVITSKLEDGAVTEIKLSDGSVTTAKLADLSVSTDKLQNASITEIKLSDGSVATAKIQNGAITSIKIEDGSIALSKLSDLMCSNGEILKKTAGDWVCGEDVGTGSVTAGDGITNSGTAEDPILDANVDDITIEIVADVIQVKDSGITSAKIANGTIVNDDIATLANIEWSKISKVGSSLADLATRNFSDLTSRLAQYVEIADTTNYYTATDTEGVLQEIGANYFRLGGNSFSGIATLGTNDAQNLVFETGGTTKLTILNSNGNVGIGNGSPTGRLSSTISNAATTTTNYTGYFENLSTNSGTDGIDKHGLYITSTGGFAGLGGTATNNYGLYIAVPSGADNNYSAMFKGTSGDVYVNSAGTLFAGADLQLMNSGPRILNGGSGNLRIYGSGTGTGPITLNETGTGNVGIGTTGPNRKLEVAITNGTNNGIRISQSDPNYQAYLETIYTGNSQGWRIGQSSSTNPQFFIQNIYNSLYGIRASYGGSGNTYSTSIGPSVNAMLSLDYTGAATLIVKDWRATTGITNALIHAGAGQSTNELLGVYANDGTTPYLVVRSGNVGIGTSNPSRKLTVTSAVANQNINIDGSGLYLARSADGGEVMSITTNGDPAQPSLNYAAYNNHTFTTLAGQGLSIQRFTSPASTKVIVGTGNASTTSSLFVVNGNTSIGAGYVNTAAPTNGLLVEGIVGVGTTSPTARLQVNSTATTLGANGLSYFDWSPGSVSTLNGDLFGINIGANGSATNLLTVRSAGALLFGVSQSKITANLPVEFGAPGDVAMAYDLMFTNPTSSYIKSNASLYLQAGEVFGSSDLTLRTFNSGSVVVDSTSLVLNGFLGCSSGLQTSATGSVSCLPSDQSLKRNVQTITSSLAQVMALRGVTYNWTEESGFGQQEEYGLIAQEVEAVAPDLVFTMGNGLKGVKYQQLTGLLIEAIKEQQSQVLSMQNRIDSLGATQNVQTYLANNIIPNITTLKIQVNDELKVLGKTELKGNLKVNQNTAGKAKIAAGQTSITVTFTSEYSNEPIVTVTPKGTSLNSAYGVTNISKTQFTIELASAAVADIEFNWIALDTGNPPISYPGY